MSSSTSVARNFRVSFGPFHKPASLIRITDYFTKLLEDDLRAVVKPQYVDQIPKAVRGTVRSVKGLLESRASLGNLEQVTDVLELNHILDRDIAHLSGGELQRFAIGTVCVQKADVYMFDEPSSYLDVKQRLSAAQIIRSLLRDNDYVIVVEHDLSVLDYLSDYICVLYGKPAIYGVVTLPHSVREGINIFLDGHIPTENLRFRDESLTFRIAEGTDEFAIDKSRAFTYPKMEKTLGNFSLRIDSGEFTDSEIIVMMGENGTGKTTFCRLLAGVLKPDSKAGVPEMRISMKPQTITPKFDGTVRQLFFKKIKQSFLSPQFQTDVVRPLKLDDFIDQEVKNLSGGELQRVAIVLALGMPADIYLIDEPSAYLDSEQRIIASRVIKRFIMHSKKTAFVVEHDFIMATYLADRVIVFDGEPGIDAHANRPESLLTGCNSFLKNLDVTFRRDPTNFRPRINKLGSQLDQEQKLNGNYVSLDISAERTLHANQFHSSSWTITRPRRLLEKGSHQGNQHYNPPDAYPGVCRVPKGRHMRWRRDGNLRSNTTEEEGSGASEDDDLDG